MKKKIVIYAVLAAMLLSGCSSSGTKERVSENEIQVKVAFATDKYEQEADISSLREGTLSVAAAKGETEGAQFIVKCDKAISDYSFVVSDLKNGDHVIESSAVTVQTQLYSYATDLNETNVLPAGYYPDALIPVEYIVKAEQNTIEKEKNQGFFVDFKIPRDADAGVYTGKITMEYDGKKVDIPVEVKVYDFEISAVPNTKTCYSIWQDWLGYGELDTTDEKYMEYYDMLSEYNVFAYTFPHTTADEYVTYVRKYYDKIPCFGIPYDATSTTTNDWEKFTSYLTALAEASVADGVNYFDKAYYYLAMFYDEYNLVEWRKAIFQSVIETCDAIEEELIANFVKNGKLKSDQDELARTILNLTHIIPGPASDDTVEGYDITFCPLCTEVDTTAKLEAYQAATPQGVEYWWYNCSTYIDYPYPSKTLNDYLITARDHFWSNYVNDIVGDLYWNTTGYCNWAAYDSKGAYSPLSDLYGTASRDNITNGDGYLLYPGLGYESDKPFASLRLTAIRDGIDDNTYMAMLGEKYADLSKTYGVEVTDAKNFVSFLNRNVISRQISKLDSEKMLDARNSLAKAIELAYKADVLIQDLSVEQNEISYLIYTDSSTELEINGEKAEASTVKEGKCYKGKVNVSESQELVMSFVKDGNTEEMVLKTVKQGIVWNDFEEQTDVKECVVYDKFGSTVGVNESENFSKSGNSARVELKGYDFENQENNTQFKPKVSFELSSSGKKLSEIEALEVWVYNPQKQDVQVEIYFEGTSSEGGKKEFSYDSLVLKAENWSKITADNFKFISRDSDVLDEYTQFGIRVQNEINQTYQLYLDDLVVR